MGKGWDATGGLCAGLTVDLNGSQDESTCKFEVNGTLSVLQTPDRARCQNAFCLPGSFPHLTNVGRTSEPFTACRLQGGLVCWEVSYSVDELRGGRVDGSGSIRIGASSTWVRRWKAPRRAVKAPRR